MDEFAGAETVNVDLGEFGFQMREEVEIPLLVQLWVMAALHENLGAAKGDGFLDFLIDFVEGDYVGVVVFLNAVEGAEFAIDVADVGVVDVAVNDVSDDLVAPAVVGSGFGELAAAIGESAELFERNR